MPSRLRQAYVIIISVIIFLGVMALPSYAGTANYTYDSSNRLIRIDYENGSKIEYTYDESGNRTVKNITIVDTTPPVTTAAPIDGTYNATQTATLTCTDDGGSGCDKIYYTTDGTTPTTSSSVYSSTITITATTTLKFFAKDLAGNTETVKTQIYTIATQIVIPGETPAYYATLQEAYNAANNGGTIRVKAVNFTENLSVNRNISVNLEGGYNNDCSAITGMTNLKGTIQTFTGGGTLTIKNFILNNQ